MRRDKYVGCSCCRCSFIFIHLCASDSIDYLGSKFVWLPAWLYACMKYTYTYCGTGRVSERTNIIDCCLLVKVVGSGGGVEWWNGGLWLSTF